MDMWFLVIMFMNNPDAKMAMFKTEKECHEMLIEVGKQYGKDPNVQSIQCMEGRITKDYIEKKEKELHL